jgi:hypothetical protein
MFINAEIILLNDRPRAMACLAIPRDVFLSADVENARRGSVPRNQSICQISYKVVSAAFYPSNSLVTWSFNSGM